MSLGHVERRSMLGLVVVLLGFHLSQSQVYSADALRRQRENEEFVLASGRDTIRKLASLMCGRQSSKSLVIALTFGRGRRVLAEEVTEALLNGGLISVGKAELATQRLHGAIETNDFDFRVFDDVDAIVGGLVNSHWQEIMAAYPQAKLIVMLGDDRLRPISIQEIEKRLIRCTQVPDNDLVSAARAMAIWNSGCPSVLQRAKVEEQIVQEIMHHAPNDRTLVLDARDAAGGLTTRNQRGAAITAFLNEKKNFFVEIQAPKEWRPDFNTLLDISSLVHHKKKRKTIFVLCPGAGATATKSLALALKRLSPEKYIDHFKYSHERLAAATADEEFDWIDAMHGLDAVLDTPIPAFWRELLAIFGDSARVVLTIRQSYSRDYASRIDLRASGGVTQNDWDTARAAREKFLVQTARPAKIPRRRPAGFPLLRDDIERYYNNPQDTCINSIACRKICDQMLSDANRQGEFFKAVSFLSVFGDSHCNIVERQKPLDLVENHVRKPARYLLSRHKHFLKLQAGNLSHLPLYRPPTYNARVPVYGTVCPSRMTTLKQFHNNNNHILRTVPKHQLLIMDITRGDGYDLLCPFLNISDSICPSTPFPNSKSKASPSFSSRKKKQRRSLLDLSQDDDRMQTSDDEAKDDFSSLYSPYSSHNKNDDDAFIHIPANATCACELHYA